MVISVASIAAVSCVPLTNVVTLALPLKFTVEPAIKPVPFTVSVNAPELTVAPFGDNELIVGAGFVVANNRLPDVPPPGAGFVTFTI